LLNYGKKILYDLQLKNKRIKLDISEDDYFKSVIIILTKLQIDNSIYLNLIKRILLNLDQSLSSELNKLNYIIVERFNTELDKYNLNWHIDDKILVQHKLELLDKLHNIEIIYIDQIKSKIYGLSKRTNNKSPLYTMLIYFDTTDIDFTGGELEFVDEIIKPYRGLVILFDSKEIHKVNLLRKGLRRCLVIKFYD